MTDSSTGGYIQPTNDLPPPLAGSTLNDFIQALVVNLSGLANTLVFPRWQSEPPNIPQSGTAWCAVGVNRQKKDNFPFMGTFISSYATDPPTKSWQLQRHREVDFLASFYDLGTDGQADNLA